MFNVGNELAEEKESLLLETLAKHFVFLVQSANHCNYLQLLV